MVNERFHMSVRIVVPALLRQVTGGEKVVSARGSNIAEILNDLETRYPGIKDKLVNEGQLKRYVNIYINDEDIRFSNGLNTVVRPGDELTILPAVAGGCGHVKAIALHDMKQQARYNARS